MKSINTGDHCSGDPPIGAKCDPRAGTSPCNSANRSRSNGADHLADDRFGSNSMHQQFFKYFGVR